MIFSSISPKIKKKMWHTQYTIKHIGGGAFYEIFVHWTQVGTNFHKLLKKNQYQLEVKVQLLLSS